MEIGILKESRADENRLPLTPMGVSDLSHAGAKVFIESKAGEKCGYADADFEAAGATICYSKPEVIGRCQLLLTVGSPGAEEIQALQANQIVACFWQLVLQKKETIELLRAKKITLLGYEIMETDDHDLPILHSSSEIAGSMCASIAQYLLQNHEGGRGILLGGGAGIPPAVVLVLGAGALGSAAAHAFCGAGAQVMVLDRNPEKLGRLHRELGGRIITSISTKQNILKGMEFANVVIGAAARGGPHNPRRLNPARGVIGAPARGGRKTPLLITRDMLKRMRPKSIFMDLSIDLGGVSETSRPTTFDNPTYVDENILHYCVPNIPSNVARTATQALNNALLPHILLLAEKGYNQAMLDSAAVRNGTYIHMGNFLKPWIKDYFQI